MNHHDHASARVDELFAHATSDTTDRRSPHPGAAVLVAANGKTLHRRGYGMADLELNRPATPATSFYLASVSKQFTAMAIMLLAEQQLLGYEDTLPTFFPEIPAYGSTITVRHLLHHTAGLKDYPRLLSSHPMSDPGAVFSELRGLTNRDVLQAVQRQKAPEFEAGARYDYSNSGYVLLALIVELVSGQPYHRFMHEHIFAPLGMVNTLVYDASRPVVRNVAQGYIVEGENYRRWEYPLLTMGDGGMYSTIDDLFLWDRALSKQRLVSPETLQLAFTSGLTSAGEPCNYGFGWMTEPFRGLRQVHHSGNLYPFNTYLTRFLDEDVTIAILSNSLFYRSSKLIYRIAEIFLPN